MLPLFHLYQDSASDRALRPSKVNKHLAMHLHQDYYYLRHKIFYDQWQIMTIVIYYYLISTVPSGKKITPTLIKCGSPNLLQKNFRPVVVENQPSHIICDL